MERECDDVDHTILLDLVFLLSRGEFADRRSHTPLLPPGEHVAVWRGRRGIHLIAAHRLIYISFFVASNGAALHCVLLAGMVCASTIVKATVLTSSSRSKSTCFSPAGTSYSANL